MEDKKLNFSRPFLSVRRNSPAVTSQKDDKGNNVPVAPQLPTYRSQLKSGPIQNPGAVPFQWEQTPGQPKDVSKQETRNHDRPRIASRLPPGRFPQASQQHSRQVTPNENSSQIVTVCCDSQSGPYQDENFKNLERYDEITEKGMHSVSGDSDTDESYVDALDTLSRTESFFINCSVSGLSGFDDLDTEPSESFLSDPKTREFMMDRFLPAAKAMASETPQCASKKEFITREPPQQSKKIVSEGKALLRYGPSFAKRHLYGHETEEQEGEESADDYNQHKKFPGVCGLLPRFCSRSSMSILNAVPAMSLRTRVPIYAANTNQTRSSTRSYSELENQSKPDSSEVKSMDTVKTSELEVDKTDSGNRTVQLQHLRAPTSCDAPFSFIGEQEITGLPEETKHSGINVKTFQELLADQSSPEESDAGEHAPEKTLYVDTMKMVETRSSASCSPSTEEDANEVPVSGEVLKISADEVDQIQLTDISPEAIKKLDIGYEKEKLPPDGHRFDGHSIVSPMGRLNPKGKLDVPKSFGEKVDVSLSSTMTKNLKVTNKDSSESLDNQPPNALAMESRTHPNHSQFPVPPSLPKSPSDSWLGRTLPSISMKKPYLRSSFGVVTTPEDHGHGLKATKADNITWETFVKSTKAQQHHVYLRNT